MFDSQSHPRIFTVPPGADFPRAVVDGLLSRLQGSGPEALAQVELFVNTRRMQRRIATFFDDGPARLLPRMRLVTDLGGGAAAGLPPAVPPLRRRLELAQLVARLIETDPTLAPHSAVYDLADSLATLMDEMHGEGVAPEALRRLDVSDASGHWQRSLAFVTLVDGFMEPDATARPDPEARQRRVVEALVARWANEPPDHPVIVAGSTGSRGTTALFLSAVARLPQGAIILPGFDHDMPDSVWRSLTDAMTGEDHPQFRFARLMRTAGIGPGDLRPWTDVAAPSPERNRAVSLALRPAPVTDQWMTEGPSLGGLVAGFADVALIEAASQREEAAAIALILRDAAETGRRAALITPDRMLTRQVSAALDRWGIVPDDSAGRPLALTAPGRFLRHVAALFGQRLTSEALLTLLKHPLTATGADRGEHLRVARDLELHLRRHGPPYPSAADIRRWAGQDEGRRRWAEWVGQTLCGKEAARRERLVTHLARHIDLATAIAAGPDGAPPGALWQEAAGEKARQEIEALEREARHGGEMEATDYAAMFTAILQRAEVREPIAAHPCVMIWGTLEARVQGADLVIAAGLNEGVWPEPPAPDPWLNRQMRHEAGLLLPERRIGLSAHDFQQAIAAPCVVLSRAIRDAEAQTVPSRWLNRIVNLLGGVSDDGRAALEAMRVRGKGWLALASTLEMPEAPVPAAPRPAPRPPVAARPRRLSITEVQTLIRDPYAVYARHVLGLRPLDPLRQSPDAPLRGTILHRILERFLAGHPVTDPERDRARLMALAEDVLAAEAPWPAARSLWHARLLRVADWFVTREIARQRAARPVALEQKGELAFASPAFVLAGKVDRIDRNPDGTLTIYDYKTGNAPSQPQIRHYDRQLHLAAVMAEAGAIAGVAAAPVHAVGHIALGSNPSDSPIRLAPGEVEAVRAEFLRLVSAYLDPATGFTARRAVVPRQAGDYDHLARHGEWEDADPPREEDVGT